jgi:methylated-DNA-protein-cysteine methyltransferase-like protein
MRRAHYHESTVSAAAEAIYQIVRRIPYGCVASYGQVARLAGLPGRARLVGRALAETPAETGSLPWHRVINAQGRISLTGPAAREQQKRLRAEGVLLRKGRVDLGRHVWKPGNDSPLLD